jgi:hypothetical protein
LNHPVMIVIAHRDSIVHTMNDTTASYNASHQPSLQPHLLRAWSTARTVATTAFVISRRRAAGTAS